MENHSEAGFYDSLEVLSITSPLKIFEVSKAYLRIVKSIYRKPYSFHEGLDISEKMRSQVGKYLIISIIILFFLVTPVAFLYGSQWIYSLFVLKSHFLFLFLGYLCFVSAKITVGRDVSFKDFWIVGIYIVGFSFPVGIIFQYPAFLYYGSEIFKKAHSNLIIESEIQSETLSSLKSSIDTVTFIFLIVTIAMIFSWVYQNQNISKWKARWGAWMAILMMTPLFILINTIF